ncbi:MAG: M23 family metallopeptidase [Propionicimonas sp.]
MAATRGIVLKRGLAAVVASGLAVAALAAFTTSSANSTGTAFADQARIPNNVTATAGPASLAELAAAREQQLVSAEDAISDSVRDAAASERVTDLGQDATLIAKEIDRLNNLSKFIWPTAGSVGSVYGMRLHPILHYYRMHDGDDIGGACGQPIYAAQSGTVVKAEMGYNGGSGNNIRIDHGSINGVDVATGYLHMTDFVVSVGDKVDQGQLIGHVGSTGLSTACHLHFSAYKNGSGTDPMEYIGWNSEAKGVKTSN